MGARPELAADAIDQALSLLIMLAAALPLPPERRPAGCTWECVALLAKALSGSECFLSALLLCLRQASDSRAVAAVSASAQLVQLMPIDQPPPGCRLRHSHFVSVLVALLGNLCWNVCNRPIGLQRFSLDERWRMAAQVLPAVSRLPQLLALVAGAAGADQLDEGQQLLLVVLSPARHQLAFLSQLWHDSGGRASGSSNGSGAAGSGSQPGRVLPVHYFSSATLWCRAAVATLRCTERLQQLHNLIQQQPRGQPAQQALPAEFSLLSLRLARTAAVCMLAAASELPDAGAAVLSDAMQTTWQLHSTACRLVHFTTTATNPITHLDGGVLCLLAECMLAAAQIAAHMQGSQLHGANSTFAPAAR